MYAPLSSLQSNAACSEAENVNVAEGESVVPDGPESIVVCGTSKSAGPLVVMSSDQPPAIVPDEVPSVSITKSFHVPIGFEPSKADASVQVPPATGPGLQ